MSGKITKIVREYILGLSIVTMIVGAVILLFGILGIWMQDVISDMISSDNLIWSPYILVIGIIIFLTGVWYLYSYNKNKKLLLDEINTNKRSEFQKRHADLKDAARHLPSKYQTLLKEKEKELKIK